MASNELCSSKAQIEVIDRHGPLKAEHPNDFVEIPTTKWFIPCELKTGHEGPHEGYVRGGVMAFP